MRIVINITEESAVDFLDYLITYLSQSDDNEYLVIAYRKTVKTALRRIENSDKIKVVLTQTEMFDKVMRYLSKILASGIALRYDVLKKIGFDLLKDDWVQSEAFQKYKGRLLAKVQQSEANFGGVLAPADRIKDHDSKTGSATRVVNRMEIIHK